LYNDLIFFKTVVQSIGIVTSSELALEPEEVSLSGLFLSTIAKICVLVFPAQGGDILLAQNNTLTSIINSLL